MGRLQLVMVALAVLVLWLALMTGAAWLFWTRGEARMAMRDQPLTLRLPEGLRASAVVSTELRSRLTATPTVEVVLDQRVPVQFDDALSARLALKTTLPVDTVIRVDQRVKVSAPVRLDVPIWRWMSPVTVTLPVTLEVPVTFAVPVQASVPLDLDVMVSGEWPDTLSVPLRATWRLQPRIDSPLQARVTRETSFVLQGPVAPLALRVPELDLRMPVNRMAIVSAPKPAAAR